MRAQGDHATGRHSARIGARSVCPLCKQDRLAYLYKKEYQSRTWRLARCLDCGLHFTDPQPTLDEIKSFYAGEYHTDLRSEGAAERIFGPKYARYIRSIRPFVASGRTLDVGCATGLFPHMLRGLGYEAEGIELNGESREFGRAHYGIPIHAGTMEEIAGLRPASYDLITMTDVLEHTENPLASLGCVNKLLKQDAYAMITFPDIHAAISRYYQWLSRITGRDWIWCTCHIPLHTWEFTESSAVNCFERAGFRVVDFRRSQNPYRFAGRLALLSFPTGIFSLPFVAARLGSQMEFVLRRVGEPMQSL